MADRGPEAAERFSDLFRAHYQDLMSFSLRRVGPDQAPDVVAETFLVAWRRFEVAPEHALPWLYRIAGFHVANLHRSEARRALLHTRLAQHITVTTNDGHTEEDTLSGEVVLLALRSLQELDQEALRLAAWEGLDAADAARVLGCTTSAYRVRLHRARRRLERRVQELSRSQNQSQRPKSASGTRATVVPVQESEHP